MNIDLFFEFQLEKYRLNAEQVAELELFKAAVVMEISTTKINAHSNLELSIERHLTQLHHACNEVVNQIQWDVVVPPTPVPNTTMPVNIPHHQDTPEQQTTLPVIKIYRANNTSPPTSPPVINPYRNNTTSNTTHGANTNATSINHTTRNTTHGANPAAFSNDNVYTDTTDTNPPPQSAYTDTQSDQHHTGASTPKDSHGNQSYNDFDSVQGQHRHQNTPEGSPSINGGMFNNSQSKFIRVHHINLGEGCHPIFIPFQFVHLLHAGQSVIEVEFNKFQKATVKIRCTKFGIFPTLY